MKFLSYDEWHSYDASLTTEKLIHGLQTNLNDAKIPITFIVRKNAVTIGMIALKYSEPEFSDYKDTIWMSSLHVAPEERGQGLGQALFEFVSTIAGCLDHKEIFFYTSKPSNVPWYTKRGAEVLEKERPYRNHTVTIMKLSCH